MKLPNHVLMVSPDYFDVVYAINPHMKTASGLLKKIDSSKARLQWENLRKAYADLGFQVTVLPGVQGLPDMVFTANQSFPFLAKDGTKKVILSNMASTERQPEVAYFTAHFSHNGYRLINLPMSMNFEAMGDAIWNYETEEIFCGYGFRTSKATVAELGRLTSYSVHGLQLVDDRFYHLDTCLTILDRNTAAYVPQAFTAEGVALIKSRFPQAIEVSLAEALENFACNAHCPDGKCVLLHPGSHQFSKSLQALGFISKEIDTSEFIKAGGSVFCMKLMYF